MLASGNAFATIVTAIYNAATDVPVTASSYTASGNTITFALNFAPATGTNLTVVNNTGLALITGTFDNLAQNQAVDLTYQGATFHYVANYFGGTGNDLVLQWAATRLVAWGYNDAGQLGSGTSTASFIAVAVDQSGVLAGKTVSQVATGANHSLALLFDGTVAAWGHNYYGTLGDGSTTYKAVPVAVEKGGALAGKVVTAIGAGWDHSLALCSDGTLVAWGGNYYGQLGNNSTVSSSVPVPVSTAGTALENKLVVAIACGYNHSLALCSDGTLVAWGQNTNGQLGNGTTSAQSLVPVAVTIAGTALEGRSVVRLAAGNVHSLAVCSDGSVATWGANSSGQLGDNSTTQRLVPVAVITAGTPLEGKVVISVAGGSTHSAALCADGTIATWGSNSLYQLGNSVSGRTLLASTVNRTGVLSSRTVVAIHAGDYFTQWVCSDGAVVSSGENSEGSLGYGSLVIPFTPVQATTTGTALAGKTVIATAGGRSHSLALCSDGTMAAWGYNGEGQLGNNGPTLVTTPANVSAAGVLAGRTVIAASAGYQFSIGLCTDGKVAAWGDNDLGQLGNGTYVQSKVPVAVTTGALANKTVIAISAGTGHALAACSDGTVAAWGQNSYGQLGNNTTSYSNLPVAVVRTGVLSGKKVVAVAAGDNFSLALCSDGTLAAWGANASGQLGNNTTTSSSVPVAVSRSGVLLGKLVTSITCGIYHSLALCSDGTLVAWGSNAFGELGNNSTTKSLVPVAVVTTGPLSSKTPVTVAAANERSFALCSDGTLVAWGISTLGDGSASTSHVPVDITTSGILSGKTMATASTGWEASFAVATDGSLASWGYSLFGEMGDGALGTSNTPVAVSAASLSPGEKFARVGSGPLAYHALAVVTTPVSAPPYVLTQAATEITSTAATLNGSVNAFDASTDVNFVYGTSAPDTVVPAAPTPVTGTSNTAVSFLLTGLAPNTTYHYRVTATNRTGTASGSDLTFTTLSNDARLSTLGVPAGTFLSPAFTSVTTSYAIAVPTSLESIVLTPTTEDSNATLQVQAGDGPFNPLASGSPSGSLALTSVGTTAINLKVTAQDGITAQTYTFVVSHQPAYALWRQIHFNNSIVKVGDMNDFDGDGVNNLTEFAFGTDPGLSASGSAPLSYGSGLVVPGSPSTEIIAGKPTAEFIRRSDFASAGLTYTMQFSSKLTTWETDARTPAVLATDGTLDVAALTYPKLSNGMQAKFFRVIVNLAP